MHFRRTGAVLRLAILTAVLTWFAQTVAEAADAVPLRTSIKDHRFQPCELKAPPNTPITLIVRNLDLTLGVFESKTLRVENVVAGNAEITIKLRPLATGRHRFYGDFNEATAQGARIAE